MTKKRIKTEKFLNFRAFGAAALTVPGMRCTQMQFHSAATAALQGAHSWPGLQSQLLQIPTRAATLESNTLNAKNYTVLVPRTVCPAL